MSYQEILKKVSEDLNLPEDVVIGVVNSFWTFIRDSIQSLPLKDNITEEEFSELKTNFNIPSLGKLHCSYDRVTRVKKSLEYIKYIKEKSNVKH